MIPNFRELKAACLREDVDEDLFFGQEGEKTKQKVAREERAKEVCLSQCPVKCFKKCEEYLRTLRPSQMQGVMAGLTYEEYREAYYRRNRKKAG